MAKKILTNKFKVHSAAQFVESFSEPANTIYWMCAAKPQGWSVSDNISDVVETEGEINYNIYDDMTFGKQIISSDVRQMCRRVDWTSGTVYDIYDHRQSSMYSKNYFVVAANGSRHDVFKCLNNNKGAASTTKPNLDFTDEDAESYVTADGYQWKYMYSITTSEWNKFATDSFIPIIPNANVAAAAVEGAIDTAIVNDGGAFYNAYANGTFSAIAVSGDTTIYDISGTGLSATDNYYDDSAIYVQTIDGSKQVKKITDYQVTGSVHRITVESAFNPLPDVNDAFEIGPAITILGDGTGALGKASVNAASSNSISQVDMISRGSGYTYAKVVISGNTQLITNLSAANVSPIISPKGGHGSDALIELDGRYVGISTTFANTESLTISADNDYRSIAVVRDMKIANVELEIIHSSDTRVSATQTLVSVTNGAEGVITNVPSADATVTINVANVTGFFEASDVLAIRAANGTLGSNIATVNSVNNSVIANRTFDQRYEYQTTKLAGANFEEDEFVSQNANTTIEANGYVHFVNANNSLVYLTNVQGIFSVSDVSTTQTMDGSINSSEYKILGYNIPDMVKGSGEVLYLENFAPISRANTQSEQFNLVIEF